MNDERIIRVSQAIAEQMGGTTFEKLAQAMLEAVPEVAELDRLTTHLHQQRAHPDFEYTVTVTGRKTNEEGRPEGEGWEPNNSMFGDRNWDRDDYTENNHWMRPVSFLRAEQDVTRKQAEERRDRIVEAGALLMQHAEKARQDMDTDPGNWGLRGGDSEAARWNRCISNAFGDEPVLVRALPPGVVILLVGWMESVIIEMDRDYTCWDLPIFARADQFASAFLDAEREHRRR